jgi:hypothetical protein
MDRKKLTNMRNHMPTIISKVILKVDETQVNRIFSYGWNFKKGNWTTAQLLSGIAQAKEKLREQIFEELKVIKLYIKIRDLPPIV